MDKGKHIRGFPASTTARIFALLLIVCLVQSTTEQRINRGSKPSKLVEKINGWRSQRGGSCLSYGHSCWGAHGKRSGKLPAAAPDWYLTRILSRIAANAEMKHNQRDFNNNDDLNAIFQVEEVENKPPTDKLLTEDNDGPLTFPFSRTPDSKPMLDDDMLSKMKLWQIMRESAEEK